MRIKKYFFANHFPFWEFMVTMVITTTTVYLSKSISDGSSIFNFIPFIIVSLMCWTYVGAKAYIFIRLYFSDDIYLGEILSVSEDIVRIGFLDLYQNRIIGAINVNSKFRNLLVTDMPVHFKTYGKWIEILETNSYYEAYKKGQYFEGYDLVGRGMMKLFAFFDTKHFI